MCIEYQMSEQTMDIMDFQEIPVLLLTGYLGSGKTTLVNRILTNKRGIRFAVIVNDIGEVNIDADLIQKGGVVAQQDDSLVALQNGCICCTLKMDLVQQLNDLLRMRQFDYIVIEASGICEPGPIAQTICGFPGLVPQALRNGLPLLDCIVTVVDALRLRDEFGSGDNLTRENMDEDDLENLVIQQIEFCNIILLNKASEVSPSELEHIRQIIRAIQPKAQIIDCDYCEVGLDHILNTDMFDFDEVATSATWIQQIENRDIDDVNDDDEDDHHHHHHDEDEHHHHHDHDHEDDEHHEHHHHDHDEHDHHHHHDHDHGQCNDPHCHCHHHHHHDGEGEAEEYGIGTFVYYRREAMDMVRFDEFVARKWPKSVIRAKGMCYFRGEEHVCYLFEQAGRQFGLRNAGQWYATMPADELKEAMERDAGLRADWDEKYGDRMQKLVFIGQKMDRKAIEAELDKCLCR